MPTVKTVIGNKMVPGFVDYYLAKNGYKAQQTDETIEPNRRDNLWEPVPGDHGVRGPFNHRASSPSPQRWADTHKLILAGVLGAAGLAGGGALRRQIMWNKWALSFEALRHFVF